jgi:hypothetical protein
MDIYPVERNTHLTAVYYNKGNFTLFRIKANV